MFGVYTPRATIDCRERGNGGHLFKVSDNRGTKASEGSKELMRGAAAVVVTVHGVNKVRTKWWHEEYGYGGSWRITEGEVLLSAKSNGTQRAG